MRKIFFAMAIMLFGYSASAQTTDKILAKYIAVKNALVSGDSKSASQALTLLQQSINDEEEVFPQKEALLKATQTMAKTSSIEKQRAAFNDISTTMWKVVSSSRKGKAPVYYQYCPMKKTYWLSTEKEIKNPYYGSAMLTCGSVVDTK